MPGKAVGRAAAGLPWLCPNSDSLIRLAEAPAGLARPSDAAPDAALLAFLLRFAPVPTSGLLDANALTSASLPETAALYLAHTPAGWLAPDSQPAQRIRNFSHVAAALARQLAERTGRACPDRAEALAQLAPLGWLAVAAVEPAAATEILNNQLVVPSEAVQAEAWGLGQNAIARRLVHRWRMPGWVAEVVGNLTLPLAAVRALTADVGPFAVVQLAVLEAERRTGSLGLTDGAVRADLLKELKLDEAAAAALTATAPAVAEPQPGAGDPNPHKVPLLPNLLKMAAESRRRNGASVVARLEDRLDDLHAAVAKVATDDGARGREAKLAALAELAAGAGHEINNPLAVISGHAQRLYRTEPDAERGESLQAIIRQTHRIAGILKDLMQFARPPRPDPRRLDAAELVHAVRDELAPLAAEKGVRVELATLPGCAFVRADRGQLKHALTAVLRNAIEAAGAGGWARVGLRDTDDEHLAFVVEDGGPGLVGPALEHAFDPFYCGRAAGRGRGLGLPVAWQLARQNGGDVRHEPTDDGPTRFVVTAPRSVTLEFRDRQSA